MANYETIGKTTNDSVLQALAAMDGAVDAYIADLATATAAEIAGRADSDRPVVMLNPTATNMAPITGIGVDCQGAVWHPGSDGVPDQILFIPTAEADLSGLKITNAEVEQPDGDETQPSGEVSVGNDPFAPMKDLDIAATLDAAAGAPMAPMAAGPDPIPPGVAGKQVILAPAKPFTYHPKSYTWYHRDNPVVITDQTATLSLPLMAEIYASPDPANKFLRLTAYGTGFTPGSLKWNNTGERGLFQDRLRTRIELPTPPAGTSLLTSEPKTKNNEASYTSSASLTVGIKGGEEPAPSGSVEISSSVTSTLSDFKVLETSAGLVGEWPFDMQLCGSKSDGQYDVNNPLSLVGFYGKVWEVPGLASSTLFPACIAAWALPLTCQANVGLKISMYQRLSYVASSWTSCMAAGCEITKPFSFSVDFGAVNV